MSPRDAEALKKPDLLFAGCRVDELPLYFLGAEADAIALYEQLFAHCEGIYFRYLDIFGDPVVIPAPAGMPPAARLRARRSAVSERRSDVRRLRSAARISSFFRANFSAAI